MGNGSFTQQHLLSTYELLCLGLDVDSLQHSDRSCLHGECFIRDRLNGLMKVLNKTGGLTSYEGLDVCATFKTPFLCPPFLVQVH